MRFHVLRTGMTKLNCYEYSAHQQCDPRGQETPQTVADSPIRTRCLSNPSYWASFFGYTRTTSFINQSPAHLRVYSQPSIFVTVRLKTCYPVRKFRRLHAPFPRALGRAPSSSHQKQRGQPRRITGRDEGAAALAANERPPQGTRMSESHPPRETFLSGESGHRRELGCPHLTSLNCCWVFSF